MLAKKSLAQRPESPFPLFVGTESPSRIRNDVKERLLGLNAALEDAFLRKRPMLDPISRSYDPALRAEFEKQLHTLHSADGNNPVTNEYFRITPDLVGRLNLLKTEHLSRADFRVLVNAGYSAHKYSQRAIASVQTSLRDFSLPLHDVPGLPHLHRANDFAAVQLYLSNLDCIKNGQQITILDIGSGTGGTVESLVHFFHALSKEDDLLDRVKLIVCCVEQNMDQFEALGQKIGLLKKHYGNHMDLTIYPLNDSIFAYLPTGFSGVRLPEPILPNSKFAPLGSFDGAVASFVFHHMTDTEKDLAMIGVRNLLKRNKSFVVNDCDGHSPINQTYFNWLSVFKHLSVFNTGEDMRSHFSHAGYSTRAIPKFPVEREFTTSTDRDFTARIKEVLGQWRMAEMSKDIDGHAAYFTAGVK